MSDTYSAQAAESPPGLTVNVQAPQPATAAVPAASDAQVDAFLGSSTPTTPAGGAPPATFEEAPGHGVLWGIGKGAGQQVLGALSLMPGIGDWFTRESYLGQRAYAKNRGGAGEYIGEAIGTVAPWLAGGAALGSVRGIGALSRLSPSLSRVLTGAARIEPTVTAEGTVAGGIARVKPTLARGAAVGAVAGAAQEPAGNTGYSGRVAPALAGALGGAALTAPQKLGVNNIIKGLSGLMGYEAYGMMGGGLALAAATYALHNMKLGVRAAEHLAPLIVQEAQRLAGPTAVAPAGAAIGKTTNTIGERTGP